MNKVEITLDTTIAALTVGQVLELIRKATPSLQPAEKSIPDIFGVETLQEISGYSRASIYAKTSRNEIPHFKRDGRLYFKHAEIMAWLTEARVETKTEFSNRMDAKLTEKS